MLPIIKVPLIKSQYSIKCPYAMKPEFITIHNTYNDASAENEIAYMQRNDKQNSFHFAVDDTEIRLGLPLNRNGWHAGDGQNGTGNRKSIGIEICYSLSGGEKFKKAQENAAELTAYLLKEYNFHISKVKKHQDWSGKYCPHRTLDEYGWDYFLNRVEYYLNGEIKVEKEEKSMRYFKLVDNMNMRSTPNGKKLLEVPNGTILSGDELKTNNGIQWLKTVYNGQHGYVAVLPESKKYAIEVAAPNNTVRYFELSQNMNMRSTPNGDIVTSVPKGILVSGSEILTINETQWVRCEYNGHSGYVAVLPEKKGYAIEVAAPVVKEPIPEPMPAFDWENEAKKLSTKVEELEEQNNGLTTLVEELKFDNEKLRIENQLLKDKMSNAITILS